MNCLINHNKKSCFSHHQLLSILLGLRDYIHIHYPKYNVVINANLTFSELTDKIKNIILIIYKKNVKESEYIKMDFYKFIKESRVKNDIKNFVFKPKINMTSPLTTIQLSQIMYRFQNLFYKNLYFKVGACDLPIDIKELLKYKKNAFILNTDSSNLSGTHWVSIYTIDDTIEYFDSQGKPPRNKCLQIFIKKLQQVYPKRNFIYNKNKFQRYGNNCGIYSIYFIIQRLLKKQFTDITNHVIDEKQIVKYRQFLLS